MAAAAVGAVAVVTARSVGLAGPAVAAAAAVAAGLRTNGPRLMRAAAQVEGAGAGVGAAQGGSARSSGERRLPQGTNPAMPWGRPTIGAGPGAAGAASSMCGMRSSAVGAVDAVLAGGDRSE